MREGSFAPVIPAGETRGRASHRHPPAPSRRGRSTQLGRCPIRSSAATKRWTTDFIERHNLAVDHRFVGHVGESFYDVWITRVEIFVVARAEIDLTTSFKSDGAVSVQFQLVQPVGGEFQKSCRDRRLIQPATVLPPPIRREVYW
jgi:hypothetical protein